MGIDPYHLNPRRERCARCGEIAQGSAHINSKRYCHGDYEQGDPTCYMRTQWEQTDAFLTRFMDENDELLRRLADR